MTTRRQTLTALLAVALAPRAALGQGSPARIGYLTYGSIESDKTWAAAFAQGLRELGYVEGRNVVIERREAGARSERLPALVAELRSLKINVLVVTGDPATHAAVKLMKDVPMVMVASPDPVGTGLVASFSRPGGNVTGLSDFHAGVAPKRFELLKEMAPSTSIVAVFMNPAAPSHPRQLKDTEAAAAMFKVKVIPARVESADALEGAFAAVRSMRADALLVLGDRLFATQRKRIAELALERRLPTIYTLSSYVHAGGLMSYGANFEDLFHRAASYVDKILKGAKPASLPVELPTKFEFTLNTRTAKALGIAVPRSVLLRADHVIE